MSTLIWVTMRDFPDLKKRLFVNRDHIVSAQEIQDNAGTHTLLELTNGKSLVVEETPEQIAV
jgi:uncharacterized protein YlzI (FlbEa/FlbD family)